MFTKLNYIENTNKARRERIMKKKEAMDSRTDRLGYYTGSVDSDSVPGIIVLYISETVKSDSRTNPICF